MSWIAKLLYLQYSIELAFYFVLLIEDLAKYQKLPNFSLYQI